MPTYELIPLLVTALGLAAAGLELVLLVASNAWDRAAVAALAGLTWWSMSEIGRSLLQHSIVAELDQHSMQWLSKLPGLTDVGGCITTVMLTLYDIEECTVRLCVPQTVDLSSTPSLCACHLGLCLPSQ